MTVKQPRPQLCTTTLWEFPSQHYGQTPQGNNEYEGVTPSYLIWNLLQRYTKPGDIVLDPMCGSGTTLDVCKDTRREGIGFDVAPARSDVREADARKIPLENNSVNFAFIDPPYSTHIRYSGKKECIGELDARGGGYYEAMEKVIAEIHRTLKPGGYFALYISDSFSKGKSFCPLGFELFLRMTRLFDPVDVICVTRHNKSLQRNHWHTSALEGNFYLRGFNYLFIVRKKPNQESERFAHEDAGWLSPLWKAAQKNPTEGRLMTPELFAERLSDDSEGLADNLSNKQKKKLIRTPKREGDKPKSGDFRAAAPRNSPKGGTNRTRPPSKSGHARKKPHDTVRKKP